MENPVVGVLSVTTKDLEALKSGASEVNLGGKNNVQARIAELNVNGLLDTLKQSSNEAYVLNWKGSKIPRGAKIDDNEIAWTQNGQVLSTDGRMIGTYDRLVEYGGNDGDEQCMIVFKL